MPTAHIARRTVAFFVLTSLPNVLGVIIIGLGLAVGLFDGPTNPALTILPAAVATAAIVLVVGGARWAGRTAERRGADREKGSRLTVLLRTLGGGIDEALALLRTRDPWLYVGLAGYLFFDAMVMWAMFHAFGSAPPPATVWMGYLIGELGGLIPVPGGVGRGPRAHRRVLAVWRVADVGDRGRARIPRGRPARADGPRGGRVHPVAPLARP